MTPEQIAELVTLATLVDALDEIEQLKAELADAKAEIARHHEDFARWEEMAAAGAGKAHAESILRKLLGPDYYGRTRIRCFSHHSGPAWIDSDGKGEWAVTPDEAAYFQTLMEEQR